MLLSRLYYCIGSYLEDQKNRGDKTYADAMYCANIDERKKILFVLFHLIFITETVQH